MVADPAPEPLVVEALGVRVAADLSVARFAPEEVAAIRTGWSRAQVDGHRVDVTVPSALLASQPSPARLAAALSTAVTLAAIDARAGELVLLHAAGVADPASGATLALVGPSGRGKTTASRVLARHWGYVSDETVGVDPVTLAVMPHPKPLSVKASGQPERAGQDRAGQGDARTGRTTPPKVQVGPDESGLRSAPGQCRLARVVLLDRVPDHTGAPEVAPVAVPRAVGELTAELSHLRRWESPLATVAGLLAATGGAVRVRYAEAADLAPLLPELVAHPERELRWWPVPVRTDDTGDAEDRPDSAQRWQRLAVDDAIADHDTVAVLLSGDDESRVVVLDGIGSTLWHHTARQRTTADLVAAVVARHGAPPAGSATALVTETLTSLQAQGILWSTA